MQKQGMTWWMNGMNSIRKKAIKIIIHTLKFIDYGSHFRKHDGQQEKTRNH